MAKDKILDIDGTRYAVSPTDYVIITAALQRSRVQESMPAEKHIFNKSGTIASLMGPFHNYATVYDHERNELQTTTMGGHQVFWNDNSSEIAAGFKSRFETEFKNLELVATLSIQIMDAPYAKFQWAPMDLVTPSTQGKTIACNFVVRDKNRRTLDLFAKTALLISHFDLTGAHAAAFGLCGAMRLLALEQDARRALRTGCGR